MPGLRLQRLAKVPWDRWFLPMLLVARFAVGVWYSVSIPLWEADELSHYEYANYIATYRSFLRADDPVAERIWEKIQPPLYYLLVGAAIAWVDRSDASGPDGPQLLLVHALDESFPYRGTALAAHVGRLVSVVLSTVAVYFAYQIAHLIFAGRLIPTAAASSLFSFWPQFLTTGSVINNDILVVTLSTVALFLMVHLVAGHPRPWHALLLAATVAVSMLTKLSSLGLLPALLVTNALLVTRLRQRWSHHAQWVTLGATLVSAVLSWYLVRNSPFIHVPLLDGTLSTMLRELLAQPVQSLQTALRLFGATSTYTAPTYFGVVGNIPLSAWHYRAGLALMLLGLAGILFLLVRRQDLRVAPLLVLVFHAVGFMAPGFALVYASRDIYLFPGRYLLPNLASVAILITYGWGLTAFPRVSFPILSGLGLGILGLSASIPPTVIAPAYPKPLTVAKETIRPQERPHVRFGEQIELLGYDIRTRAVSPGGAIDLTFYFEGLQDIEEDYTLVLELVGPGFMGVSGGLHVSYPGRGSFPTSEWQPGTVAVIPMRVYAPLNFPAPSLMRFRLAFLESPLGRPLPARDPAGIDVTDTLYLGAIKVRAPARHPAPLPRFVFADGIALVTAATAPPSEGQLSVTLQWYVLRQPSRDYTVFAHVKDAFGRLIGQQDAPPQDGWYPTSYWEPGEVLIDRFTISLRPHEHCGPASLVIGLYETSTLTRLPVRDEEGRALPGSEVPAAYVTIPCN
ncbi:MAG TPA: glycosyltransferase family 39 protein [Alphaproteobacteria bacterium]|nr:glycosyltransferase family 39 protein [Alphaproteobacteria bacterium]